MKKIMIMLVLIISMNIITPVLANKTEVTTDISIQRETVLLIQRYKLKIVLKIMESNIE